MSHEAQTERFVREKGAQDFIDGVAEAACPYLTPENRERWLEGWRGARERARAAQAGFGADQRHRDRQAVGEARLRGGR